MLKLKGIKKSYKTGDFVQHALKGVDIEFRENEFVAILGPSGSGKTTLLNIIGGLDRYDQGDLIINNKSTKKFKNKEWDAYRNNCIGFIFQSYNLISHISVLDNVMMSLTLSGVKSGKAKRKAKELLKKVGLKDHAHKKPNQLSGGQMQRVAIARALSNDPKIILADEPTGALDSKTSVQIMELIKEIAEDKLVIMVTHNPELANTYANRVIEFKDGDLVKDSNPIKKSEEQDNEIKIRKTKMGFLTALKLSFNNIKTKKGRTLITAFASSIGIIGIALILSLSNGFQLQIDQFEKDTLSQMPITIAPTSMVMDEEAQEAMMKTYMSTDNAYSDEKRIFPLIDSESIIHYNHLTDEYIKYIEDADKDMIGGLMYGRTISLNMLHKNYQTKKVDLINSELFVQLPENADGTDSDMIMDNFDVIAGRLNTEINEVIILIDINNQLSENVLKLLGYDHTKPVDFDDIIGTEFKVVKNDLFYTDLGNTFMPSLDYEGLYDNKDNVTLKITGIMRGKEGSKFGQYSGTGLCYRKALVDKFMDDNQNSKIVKAQTKADYNVLTGEKFDLTTEEGKLIKNQILGYVGGKTAPSFIQIYPKDFNAKEDLVEYLDEYNDKLDDDEKILYTDMAAAISSLSGGIMDGVTIVLIAFSAISLVVSSIMIGIIMYISVLERTKEIGILKALGARNKDITRVFNAETFIIGITSGLLGLLIARILCIPANSIIKSLTDLENVAQLKLLHALILLIVSVSLTLIGGFIPAKMASKKDAVIALRTE